MGRFLQVSVRSTVEGSKPDTSHHLEYFESDLHDACDRKQQPAIALSDNVMLTCITMKKASVRELRYSFKRIERLLQQGDEIQITKRRQVIARLVPELRTRPAMPDFVGRLRAIYGNETLKISGAELIEQDRSRY